MMGRRNGASAEKERLHVLLRHVKRRFCCDAADSIGSNDNSSRRPNDAAAVAVGRELAEAHLATVVAAATTTTSASAEDDDDNAVLETLCQETLHPSIPDAFFAVVEEHLARMENSIGGSPSDPLAALDFLHRWPVRVQAAANGRHVVRPCLRAYASYLAVAAARATDGFLAGAKEREEERALSLQKKILRTFHSFRSTSTVLVRATREVVTAALSSAQCARRGAATTVVLSPALAVALLSPSTVETSAKFRALQHVRRQARRGWNGRSRAERCDWLQWMVQAWTIYVRSSVTSADATGDGAVEAAELAESWWMDLVELALLTCADDGSSDDRLLPGIYQQLTRSVPLYCQISQQRIASSPGVVAVTELFETTQRRFELDATTCLTLCAVTLASVDIRDRVALLQYLSLGRPPSSPVVRTILQTSVAVSKQDAACYEAAVRLQEALLTDSNPVADGVLQAHVVDRHRVVSLIELFQEGKKGETSALVGMVGGINDFSATDFFPVQQMAALLFGIALLEDWEDTEPAEKAYGFLKSLVHRYPHLGIPLLSVFSERIKDASSRGDGKRLLQDLEFLCENVTADPHCAQQVWNMVGIEWINPQYSPLALRIALVRLFPRLVAGNKRLYQRVMELLGTCIKSKEEEIRLAAAATVADLAEQDNIRDVSDVIGWLQDLLTTELSSPVDALLVHYAVISLHYLILAEELDFDVVVKVLNKRLCAVTSIDSIAKLPLVVIEALVLLLGDGECGGGSSESDEGETIVSPQVKAAVQTLLHFGSKMDDISGHSNVSRDASRRIRQNIFQSLSRYSLEALGVDEIGVKAAVSSTEGGEQNVSAEIGERYLALRELVVAGLQDVFTEEKDSDGLRKLVGELLQYEEEVLGSSLWLKRGRSQKHPRSSEENGGKHGSNLLSLLPSHSKIKEYVVDQPSPASSIARLLADGTELTTLRDNADASIDVSDMLWLAFSVQGYLQTASKLLLANTHSVGEILAEIESWNEIFISPDAMYLALCSLSVYIPSDLQDKGSGAVYVEKIYETVIAAFADNSFQKQDVAMISIGLLGVNSLRCRDADRINEIVDMMEQSVLGYGGQQSFGAYYGLALIAQEATQSKKQTISTSERRKLICRIVSFIFEELISCFKETGSTAHDLLNSLKTGAASKELIEAVSNLDSNSIASITTKQVVARYLFLSCSVCLPSILAVDGKLLQAVLLFLTAFEWGSGKGLAMLSVIRTGYAAGVLPEGMMECLYTEIADTFNERMENKGANKLDDLEDIFYALNGHYWKQMPPAMRRLVVKNSTVLEDEGSVLSLMALVSSVCSAACFGTGSLDSLAQLVDEVPEAEIKRVIGVVSNAAALRDESHYCDMGKIMIGLLCTATAPSEASSSEKGSKTRSTCDKDVSIKDEESDVDLDLQKLPTPRGGTVLASVCELIEQSFDATKSPAAKEAVLCRALAGLEVLSVPQKYAKSLIEPLLRKNFARGAAVSLLCSQISGRRRAYVEGRDFVSLALQICTASLAEWRALLGEGSGSISFLEKLPGIVPKFPLEQMKGAMKQVWQKCLDSGPYFGIQMMSRFLTSMRELLASTVVSMTAMDVLRSFVCGQLLSDVQNLQLENSMSRSTSLESIFELYVACIKEIPVSALDDTSFFELQEVTNEEPTPDIFRSLVALELITLNYFGSRGTRELAKVHSWFSKVLLSTSMVGEEVHHRDSFQRVSCAFAAAATMNKEQPSSSSKRDRLMAITEALLLTDARSSRMVLEWFAVALAYCYSCDGTERDLSLGHLCTVDRKAPQALPAKALDDFFSIMLRDLPSNLAHFSRKEKLSATVSNQLHRLYAHWSESDGGVDEELMECVRRAILSCQTTASPNQDAFAEMVSSMLSGGGIS